MTGCQNEPAQPCCDLSSSHCPKFSARQSLLIRDDAYGVDEASHPRIAAQLMASPHAQKLQIVVNRRSSQQPQHIYRYFRDLGATFLQFIPLVETEDSGSLSSASVQPEEWGAFLVAVFDLWVREDMGKIRVHHFDCALNIWRGHPAQIACDGAALPNECRECMVYRFCHGDCPKHRIASGKSALCVGYRHFFTYSAPHMKAMRDLLKQQRSPIELMALLKRSQ